jgi:hypothetical protein
MAEFRHPVRAPPVEQIRHAPMAEFRQGVA